MLCQFQRGYILGFATLRCLEKLQKSSPKWWWMMVVYHGTIRKKSEKQTNLSVDTLISAWAIQEHLTALPLGIGSSFSQFLPRFTTRLLSESSGGGKISFGSISGTSVKHQLFLVLLFDGRNPANQLRLAVHPIIYEVFYIPGGAGILPSTVWLKQTLQKNTWKNSTISGTRTLSLKWFP